MAFSILIHHTLAIVALENPMLTAITYNEIQGVQNMFYTEPQTLVVVCKDEMLVNQLRKLVETKDDTGEESVIGTRDGSVKIVAWTEKVWLDQKKAGNIDSKVLLVGDIKGVDKLIPVLDIRFEECGVKYGWAGNQAVIAIDPKALKKEEDYNAFLEKLNALPVPEIIKKKPQAAPKENAAKAGAAVGIAAVFGMIAGLGAAGAELAMSVFSNKTAVKQQMLFYGVLNLYNNHLEEFMQA